MISPMIGIYVKNVETDQAELTGGKGVNKHIMMNILKQDEASSSNDRPLWAIWKGESDYIVLRGMRIQHQ